MPARWLRPKCRHIFTLLAVLFTVSASVEAQSSVTLRGTVSETVTLSVAPTFKQSNVDVVSSGGNTVRITLPGDDVVIRVPLLVRSNTSFKISAVFESTTAELSQLSVSDVQASGALVSPQVINSLAVRRDVDMDVSRPLLVMSGPRVSLGGTLESPNNALQITVLIRLSPQTGPGSLAHLTFVGSPIQ
jgi:hypothetical protein